MIIKDVLTALFAVSIVNHISIGLLQYLRDEISTTDYFIRMGLAFALILLVIHSWGGALINEVFDISFNNFERHECA